MKLDNRTIIGIIGGVIVTVLWVVVVIKTIPERDARIKEENSCIWSDCDHARKDGSIFCYYHAAKSSIETSKEVDRIEASKENAKKAQDVEKVKNNSSSTKKSDLPDCDDYEDYEEFMDEWDGCMPDGSDAEDYWEDW